MSVGFARPLEQRTVSLVIALRFSDLLCAQIAIEPGLRRFRTVRKRHFDIHRIIDQLIIFVRTVIITVLDAAHRHLALGFLLAAVVGFGRNDGTSVSDRRNYTLLRYAGHPFVRRKPLQCGDRRILGCNGRSQGDRTVSHKEIVRDRAERNRSNRHIGDERRNRHLHLRRTAHVAGLDADGGHTLGFSRDDTFGTDRRNVGIGVVPGDFLIAAVLGSEDNLQAVRFGFGKAERRNVETYTLHMHEMRRRILLLHTR